MKRYVKQVTLLADAGSRDCGWTQLCEELGRNYAIRIVCRARLREYRFRMSIEQGFRDDKSSGFDLEHTRLQHAQRSDRLLLAIAIATLWCRELG